MPITRSLDTMASNGDDAPVSNYVDALLALAVKRRASDIHLEPQKTGLTIRLRIDGLLHQIPSPPDAVARRLCTRIKVLADLDIAERRLPQDGRIFARCNGKALNLRASSLPTLWGEKLVLRLVQTDSPLLALEDLGLTKAQLGDLLGVLAKPQGLILVTGPTGSGKTQTLYSALQWLNQQHRNISTAEEPVEIPLAGINQVGIKPSIGLGFAAALRALLRQDPDILMVGEIRDADTAAMAIRAAQTGHLVLSTVHTKSAPATLVRLNQLGINREELLESVSLILAQRLIRRLCDHCKQLKNPPCLLPELQKRTHRCYRANMEGCDKCWGGYWGRLGVFDLHRPTRSLDGEHPSLSEASEHKGSLGLRDISMQRHLAGMTSADEINRVVPLEIMAATPP